MRVGCDGGREDLQDPQRLAAGEVGVPPIGQRAQIVPAGPLRSGSTMRPASSSGQLTHREHAAGEAHQAAAVHRPEGAPLFHWRRRSGTRPAASAGSKRWPFHSTMRSLQSAQTLPRASAVIPLTAFEVRPSRVL